MSTPLSKRHGGFVKDVDVKSVVIFPQFHADEDEGEIYIHFFYIIWVVWIYLDTLRPFYIEPARVLNPQNPQKPLPQHAITPTHYCGYWFYRVGDRVSLK